MVPMDILSVIEKVLVRWQPHMAREKVESRLQKVNRIPMVNGNAHALEQVFNNLFSNAIRAMHETNGGLLHVKMETLRDTAGQEHIQINVSDTGPGIPQEHLERIFQPFFTTDKESGTGLGLAITQRIIIAHKGKIQVESFKGGGTVFHIQLPAVHLQ
jgi:two-component system sensor histidine kinase BaeS